MRHALLLVLFAVAAALPPRPSLAETIAVRAEPVPLRPDGDPEARAGRFLYRGGLALTAPDQRFGGLSGLRVAADGRSLTAVSDHGYRVDLALAYDPDGRLAGVGAARLTPLRGPKGGSLAELPGGNAEALASADSGGLVIAFEGRPRLWTYDALGEPPKPLAAPPGLERAPRNEGIEALTRLADGRLLALTEGLVQGEGVAGWIGGGAGWRPLVWLTGNGFRPTGAATLPDGDVLVLERRIFPPAGRVRLLRAVEIAGGSTLDGVEIARLDGAATFDNMEGIDARRAEDGSTLVYLVSDDNYAFYQRTLLLMFRLIE